MFVALQKLEPIEEDDMRFMVFVKGNEKSEAGALPDEKILQEMGVYNQELIDAGMMLAGEGLKPSSTATRVRYSKGKTKVVDGPFSEAKEVVAGYWILKAKSKADVIDWIKRAPCQDGSELEVRQIYESEDFGGDPATSPPPPPPAKPGTKRYVSMLFGDSKTEVGTIPSQELIEKMGGLMTEIAAQGALVAGDGLQPSSKGAKVRFSGKSRTVIDGPFTEAKEIIAGISVFRAATKEEAIEWSRRCLAIHCEGVGVSEGQIEVRPIYELEDFPVNENEKAGEWRDQERAFRESNGQA
jgi:hypothetical protein